MNLKMVKMATWGTLVVVLGGMWQAKAQDSKTPYPSMAPVEQYLMGREAEIALARSAAPESISRDAKVLVLGRHGYETAAEGKNGFVCLVERSWMALVDNTPEFGTLRSAFPSATTRPPRTFSFRLLSTRQRWRWLAPRSSTGSRPSERKNLRPWNPVRCRT